MSTENIQAFLEKAAQDPLLNEKIKGIIGGAPESGATELAHLAAESGIAFSADEFLAYVDERTLEDAELSEVAGGGMAYNHDPNKVRDGDKFINFFKNWF